eukprot:3801004-Alexandrium_andersonii.AAC.1
MRHLTACHVGQPLGEFGVLATRGLGRGACPQCTGLRSLWSRQCHRCGVASQARSAQSEDRVAAPAVALAHLRAPAMEHE